MSDTFAFHTEACLNPPGNDLEGLCRRTDDEVETRDGQHHRIGLARRAPVGKATLLRPRDGPGLGEYLCRALSHRATLAEPKDLAWLLASYARDALARVEAAGDSPSLAAARAALEEAHGIRFEGDKGARFFQSTRVQTLFYGVFSAWVLWARQTPPRTGVFNCSEAFCNRRGMTEQHMKESKSALR